MKKIIILLMIGAALDLMLAPNATAVEPQTTNVIAEGARLYNEDCGRCHNPRPASDYSKSEWSVVMPHMREKAHMTGKEALAVEAFINSTLTRDIRNREPFSRKETAGSSLTAGQIVDKYGCQGCHQIHGSGGQLGPALDGVVSRRGVDYVRQKLRNPKFDNAASPMPRFPLSEEEINTLVESFK